MTFSFEVLSLDLSKDGLMMVTGGACNTVKLLKRESLEGEFLLVWQTRLNTGFVY